MIARACIIKMPKNKDTRWKGAREIESEWGWKLEQIKGSLRSTDEGKLHAFTGCTQSLHQSLRNALAPHQVTSGVYILCLIREKRKRQHLLHHLLFFSAAAGDQEEGERKHTHCTACVWTERLSIPSKQVTWVHHQKMLSSSCVMVPTSSPRSPLIPSKRETHTREWVSKSRPMMMRGAKI